MTVSEVLKLLESKQDIRGIDHFNKLKLKGLYSFGIGVTKLRAIAKSIKTNHELAMELVETECFDAIIISSMIADPKKYTRKDAEKQLKRNGNWLMTSLWVGDLLYRTSYADDLIAEWLDDKLAKKIIKSNNKLDAGILALYLSPHFLARRNLIKYPLVFEGVHLLEHTTLLISVILGAAPWGASTLFSSLTGSQLSIHRIWWHLIMNFTAFLLTILALTLKKLPALSTILITVLTTNIIPIIVAYNYGAANSGYYSIDSLVSSKVFLSLIINPIFFTGLYLIYKNKISNIKIKNS
jgi:hypothetical protein